MKWFDRALVDGHRKILKILKYYLRLLWKTTRIPITTTGNNKNTVYGFKILSILKIFLKITRCRPTSEKPENKPGTYKFANLLRFLMLLRDKARQRISPTSNFSSLDLSFGNSKVWKLKIGQ